jgi:GR25 family glycosyltransferase involved in LPS biosynthesis
MCLSIYIICNETKENDRLESIKKQLEKIKNKNSFEINFYSYLWGDEITNDIYNKYCKTDNSMKYHGRKKSLKPLSKGELSLCLNNIECLKKIKNKYSSGYFLILESDFIFHKNFEENLINLYEYLKNYYVDFDIINIGTGFRKQMGHELKKNKPLILNKNLKLYLEKKNCCTEGILWNYDSINKFLNYFNNSEDINGPWDTILDELHRFINCTWKIFMLDPSIVDQGSIKGLFKSKIH